MSKMDIRRWSATIYSGLMMSTLFALPIVAGVISYYTV